jgi:hypothetical protein
VAVKLNQVAFEHAKRLIDEDRFVSDERGAWRKHQPSVQQENDFISRHGLGEYRKWHLGLDDGVEEGRKSHYKFPYGDFENVHQCGVLAAESRAGQYRYFDVERAAAHLHGMLDEARKRAGGEGRSPGD